MGASGIPWVDAALNWRHGGTTEISYAFPDAVPADPVRKSVRNANEAALS